MKNSKFSLGVLVGVVCSLLFVLVWQSFGETKTMGEIMDRSKYSGSFDADWNGKKVAWYGDSLTEIYLHCKIVDDYFNFNGVNCGIRGASVSYPGDGVINAEYSLCLSERMKMTGLAIPDDVDVIFVMGGTNDWCANTALGDKTLRLDAEGKPVVDHSTFYGACHEMFYNLTKMYPDAYIMALGTPIVVQESTNIYNGAGFTSFDYGAAMCEIAGMWGIPAFNIGTMMGINVNNVQDAQGLMYEQIHFTEGGARMAADVIIQEISARKFFK